MKRTASAFAMSDCVLFTIEKVYFLQYFGKAFTRSEIEKKSFIASHIEVFKDMRSKFDAFYRQILPMVSLFAESK